MPGGHGGEGPLSTEKRPVGKKEREYEYESGKQRKFLGENGGRGSWGSRERRAAAGYTTIDFSEPSPPPPPLYISLLSGTARR
jgi:hypothetical protein